MKPNKIIMNVFHRIRIQHLHNCRSPEGDRLLALGADQKFRVFSTPADLCSSDTVPVAGENICLVCAGAMHEIINIFNCSQENLMSGYHLTKDFFM